MLHDRIVYGINDKAIQKRLLAEPRDKLTFKRAIELAQELEMADLDMRLLHSPKMGPSCVEVPTTSKQESVHKLAARENTPSVSCFRFGGKGHIASHCRFPRSIVCNSCGKTGHIRKACKARRPDRSKAESSSSSSVRRSVHQVQSFVSNEDEQDTSDVDEHLFCVNTVTKSPPLMIEILLDNQKVSMEIDTGASVSVISE